MWGQPPRLSPHEHFTPSDTACPTWTTPSSPHGSRTCHALRHQAEWMRNKCRYRVPTWRNVPVSVETETDECPRRPLHYRRARGRRPCSQGLREKRSAAPKRIRGSRERSVQSDSPVFQACLLWIHSAHDNKPKPCVCRLEPVSHQTDWAGPAEQTDDRRAVPFAPPFPKQQSPQRFRPDAPSLPASNRKLSREWGSSAHNPL